MLSQLLTQAVKFSVGRQRPFVHSRRRARTATTTTYRSSPVIRRSHSPRDERRHDRASPSLQDRALRLGVRDGARSDNRLSPDRRRQALHDRRSRRGCRRCRRRPDDSAADGPARRARTGTESHFGADRDRRRARRNVLGRGAGLRVGLVFFLAVRGVGTSGRGRAARRRQHPRMLLDGELRAAWKTQAKAEHGPVVGAIALCDDARDTHEHDRALYQGAEWSKVLQACLVAWAATDDPEHAATAIRYFTALLDDLDKIGDGKGGDEAATRDAATRSATSGRTRRSPTTGCTTRRMTPALRQRARSAGPRGSPGTRTRAIARASRARTITPATSLAATLIAIAQGGEAAEEDGPKLWARRRRAVGQGHGRRARARRHPRRRRLARGLAVRAALGRRDRARCADACAARRASKVEGVEPWLSSVLRRHVYALSPGDLVYAGQDTEAEQANLAPHVLTLDAIALGDATPDDKQWAQGRAVAAAARRSRLPALRRARRRR